MRHGLHGMQYILCLANYAIHSSSNQTMSHPISETQTIEEREQFVKNELLPNISKMRRYLGTIDYNTEFYRFKRQGQTSWEFEDRDTKTTFEASIIGEIADATHGTLLKGKGNYKPFKSNTVSHPSFSILTYHLSEPAYN
jgi:hypothetical protein